MNNTDKILHKFLVESQFMSESNFTSLTEESKIEAIKDLASNILKSITSSLPNIETTAIDRSKGDIKQFKDFEVITKSLTNLEGIIDKSASQVSPELLANMKLIARTILYMNQYSAQFKDAYRNKKTLLILKYQSLVLSIISATSYLISTLVDFSNDNVVLNPNPRFEDIAPFKTLRGFVRSVDNGDFRLMLRDTQIVRESFNEFGKVELSEAGLSNVMNIADTILTGLKGFVSNLDAGGKVTNLLYKAAMVVALIFSLREIFYSLGNMKTKISDMIGGLNLFGNIGSITTQALSKLNKFSGELKAESEFGTEMAQREIESENKELASLVSTGSSIIKPVEQQVSSNNDFGGFFNF